MQYQRKEQVLKEMIEKAGYFSIITTKKMEAEEALETYRDRDAVEKSVSGWKKDALRE